MVSSLSGLRQRANIKNNFERKFLDSQRLFFASETKQAPLSKIPRTHLASYEFIQPSPNLCRFFTIDIDNVFAWYYIKDIPQSIWPHAVVLTEKGLQAFWLIEPVALTERAHRAPIDFANDVANLLRKVLCGDTAVQPMTPVKCRNPLYQEADVFHPVDRKPYTLNELKTVLKTLPLASMPEPERKPRPQAPHSLLTGELVEGSRNETIFHLARHAAYRGEDYETLAYVLNEQCTPPLPEAEIAGIVRSIARFMEHKYKSSARREDPKTPVPQALRELMEELGRKGGSINSKAQQDAFAQARRAGNAAKSAQSINRKAKIIELKKQGYKNKEIAEKLGLSLRTIGRALAQLKNRTFQKLNQSITGTSANTPAPTPAPPQVPSLPIK